MAKGSQLSQLKSALSQAGITRQEAPNKKRKRTDPSAKLQAIHERLNPFDIKVTKLKHDVGGRKIRGVTGRPAKSKQTGLDQVRHIRMACWRSTKARGSAKANSSQGVRGQESGGRHTRPPFWRKRSHHDSRGAHARTVH
jgi:hypothetical protein